MQHDAYHLILPAQRTSRVVFACPHSGRDYSAAFLQATALDPTVLRSSEDAFVDLLFQSAPLEGAALLVARAPRAFVDLNRNEDEFDPALILGVPRLPHNPRIASGLGVIPRVVANGRAIYCGKLPLAEAQERIAKFWRPYHLALATLLSEQRKRFGQAILIDCHSMPHEAIVAFGASVIARNRTAPRPDVVLGDRYGAASAGWVMDRVEAAFVDAGFRVARNAPFAGAFVAQQYGRPSIGQHVIQVEIDRALYMDESRIVPNAQFDEMRLRLAQVTARIAALGVEPERDDLRLAAE
ncbi:MAG: N-formylglutamate amidohydrolase [Paracoccaceae bacterium]|nr:N-formylglutamate amidohydrolase [Paracoccaceae bacterium]